jgi:hypothetical protein
MLGKRRVNMALGMVQAFASLPDASFLAKVKCSNDPPSDQAEARLTLAVTTLGATLGRNLTDSTRQSTHKYRDDKPTIKYYN